MPNTWLIVGRTPRSAADAPVGSHSMDDTDFVGEKRALGVGPTILKQVCFGVRRASRAGSCAFFDWKMLVPPAHRVIALHGAGGDRGPTESLFHRLARASADLAP